GSPDTVGVSGWSSLLLAVWSYTFTSLILLPLPATTSRICTSPSPPTSKSVLCVVFIFVFFLIAIMVLPPHISLYTPCVMFRLCGGGGSWIITISAFISFPHSSTAIVQL